MYDTTISKVNKMFQEIKSGLESKFQSQSSALARDQRKIKDVTENLKAAIEDITTFKGSIVATNVFLKI